MHWWPKVQASGTGLALMSTLAPTLEFPIPLWIRWIRFAIGVIMFAWPVLALGYERGKRTQRIIAFAGMIVCGLGTLGFGIWLFWPSTIHAPSQSTAHSIPSVASLRYNFANVEIHHCRSADVWTGQINVELVNNTDHILHFVAITEGNINGMPFSEGKDTVRAIIYPRKSGWLLSRRISGFNENKDPSHRAPAFRGHI